MSNQKWASKSANHLEREGEEGERVGWGGQQAGIFKVRLGLGEIEGRDWDTVRKRDIETKRHRDRVANKNP